MDVRQLRKEFEEAGPAVPGIKPAVAVERLKRFKEELAAREKKLEIYRAGST
jgi:hypothetical protein